MAKIKVGFTYVTGLMKNRAFEGVVASLDGSWDESGIYSGQWSSTLMEEVTGEDGRLCFKATIELDDSQVGHHFNWGVMVGNSWGISTEIKDHESYERYRSFELRSPVGTAPQEENYYLTHLTRLGANKYYLPGESEPGIRFAVWAPNAEEVEVVFGKPKRGIPRGDLLTGYIADDGYGIDMELSPIPMLRQDGGVWETKNIPDFSKFDHKPYMFRIKKRGGGVAYRTDLYSRCQIGSGTNDPQGAHYDGHYTELDGTKSCSVVVDPDTVTKNFKESVWPEIEFISEKEFWKNEFRPDTKDRLPRKISDCVIYELHIGALWSGSSKPGDTEDAIKLLDYLEDLGVNTVELLPMSEYRGGAAWGYATSHYFAIEYSSGGRDQLKHFVRECHRRGIAVILDVVYNHYHHEAERAEWMYDSDNHEENIYYWYEGNPSAYSNANPSGHGGYLDNGSTGYTPRFHDEMVRKMFISSAVALAEEFHMDGFRVDLTTAMHRDNVLHADGKSMSSANVFGAKLLRELCTTLKLINPRVFLVAEDHSGWNKTTESTDSHGLGFDSTWYSDFYHHLIGDSKDRPGSAKLLKTAGYGHDGPLRMDYFAGALEWSAHKKVVYHESHDEAGNSEDSNRTILTAINSASLWGQTRKFAEARTRFCCGMTMLSAGTPMFLMGEEVGAQKDYRHNDFVHFRENYIEKRANEGKNLFRFYQDIIRLRLGRKELCSRNIDIIHSHNDNRLIVFRRWDGAVEFLVVASLNNHPFTSGYILENELFGNGRWREVFNSDAEVYGGDNIGNHGATIHSNNNSINVVIPANGFVVFEKEGL
jgi:1,4-alpha-glucan branching enzyme